MLEIISKRKIWFSFSSALMVLAILFLGLWGLNFGIDFVGGSSMEVRFDKQAPEVTKVREALSGVNLDSLIVQPTSEQEMLIKFKNTEEEIYQAALGELKGLNTEKYGQVTELRFDSVGPAIGNTLKQKSFYAVILVILAIIVYIAWAFRKVAKPIASWKYGVTAVITLIHDCLVVLGVFAVLGQFYGVEITGAFIAAILTVLGYSVNDTIVMFDRIRENLPRSEDDFAGTINTSINQNITRSINTSLTTMLVLLAILLFGGGSIFSFTLALLIGVFIGTYSSIFLASPMLVLWEKRA